MIKYSLICKDCNLIFESWFASSKEYEKLKKKNFLNCHSCNSIKIEKNLMAPSLINNKTSNAKYNKQLKKFNRVRKTISEYQKFIKNNLTESKKQYLNIKNLLKIILNMWGITLLMKQEQFTITKKNKKKVFMALHQSKI